MSDDEATIKRLMEENQKKLKQLEKQIRFNKAWFVLAGGILGATVYHFILKLSEVLLP